MDVGTFNMTGKSPGDPFTFPHMSSSHRLPTLGGYPAPSPRNLDPLSPGLSGRDLGILPKLTNSGPVTGYGSKQRDDPGQDSAADKRKKPGTRMKSILGQAYGKSYLIEEEEKPKEFNPDPLPFQSSSFNKLAPTGLCGQTGASSDPPLNQVQIVGMAVSLPNIENQTSKQLADASRSSTIIKKVPMTKRHGDMWAAPDYGVSKNRGLVLHSDRYQWDSYSRSLDSSLSQRDRLMAEFEYMEKLRGLKRKREVLSHREPLHFHMGGQKVEMCERDDIMSELNRLKQVVLPARARDLYIGRGFRLPSDHALNKPRVRSLSPKTVHTAPAGIMRSSICNRSHANPTPPTPRRSKTMLNIKTQHFDSDTFEQENIIEGHKGSKLPTNINVNLSASVPNFSEACKPHGGPSPHNNFARQNRRPKYLPKLKLDEDEAETSPRNTTNNKAPPLHSEVKSDHDGHDARQETSLLQGEQAKEIAGPNFLDGLNIAFKTIFNESEMPWKLVWGCIKPLLTSEMSVDQENFARQVYHVECKSHSLVIEEFVSLGVLCKQISLLTGKAQDAYRTIDWDSIDNDIAHLSGLFRGAIKVSGKITHGVLREMLERDGGDIGHQAYMELKQVLNEYGADDIHKIDFIAHIPYLLSLRVP